MNNIDTIRKYKKQINNISSKYHAQHIRLFGSVVRGDNTPASDVDFLVQFMPEASLMDQAGIISELSDLLNCPVDVVSENALNPLISERIIKESVPL